MADWRSQPGRGPGSAKRREVDAKFREMRDKGSSRSLGGKMSDAEVDAQNRMMSRVAKSDPGERNESRGHRKNFDYNPAPRTQPTIPFDRYLNPRPDLHHDRRWEGKRKAPTDINELHARGVNPNGGDTFSSGNMNPTPPPPMSSGGGMRGNGTTESM